jgi:hypothetical protein
MYTIAQYIRRRKIKTNLIKINSKKYSTLDQKKNKKNKINR